MTTLPNKAAISIFLLFLFCVGSANASLWLPGTAVGSPGSETMVGSIGGPSPDGQDPFNGQTGLTSATEYFIPLNDTNYGGTYGLPGTSGGDYNCAGGGTANAGTCADYGNGSSSTYNDANALVMNIWYDTNNAQFNSAELGFAFDDLDLMPDNDPNGFYESISLSYWSYDDVGDDFDLNSVGGTVKTALNPVVAGVPTVVVPNLIMWSLGLTDLAALNTSSQEKGGFWIQLGFGAKSDFKGTNTPEYLATALHVSPVPLPSAVWLFGTALLGFIGISRRTKV